eukprot:sb/3467567/
MVDSEAAMFDGFGGSTRCIESVSSGITELTQSLADMAVPEESATKPPAAGGVTPTPDDNSSRATPTNPTPAPPPKKKVESKLSTPRTPLRGDNCTGAARSKAAINKSGLGAKRPLNRPTNPGAAQRAKSMATRDRPTSVKTRGPTTPSSAGSGTGSLRSRRNSDIVSVSNLSVRSEADLSRSGASRGSLRKPGTSPAKRTANVKSKVDCHRTPRTNSAENNNLNNSKVANTTTDKKSGVRSQISSLVTKKTTRSSASDSTASAPTTPRTQRSVRPNPSAPPVGFIYTFLPGQ